MTSHIGQRVNTGESYIFYLGIFICCTTLKLFQNPCTHKEFTMMVPAEFVSDEEKTFQYQDTLPPLPQPLLEKTLQKYLDSGMWCRYFLSNETCSDSHCSNIISSSKLSADSLPGVLHSDRSYGGFTTQDLC